jgi:hypothetical protein
MSKLYSRVGSDDTYMNAALRRRVVESLKSQCVRVDYSGRYNTYNHAYLICKLEKFVGQTVALQGC